MVLRNFVLVIACISVLITVLSGFFASRAVPDRKHAIFVFSASMVWGVLSAWAAIGVNEWVQWKDTDLLDAARLETFPIVNQRIGVIEEKGRLCPYREYDLKMGPRIETIRRFAFVYPDHYLPGATLALGPSIGMYTFVSWLIWPRRGWWKRLRGWRDTRIRSGVA